MNKQETNTQNGNGTVVIPPDSDHSHNGGSGGKWKGENVDIYVTMQSGIYNLFRERIIKSGATDLEEINLEAILEHATAMAEEAYRRRFDPAANIDDKLKERVYLADCKELEESILGVKHTKAELNSRKDAEAKVKAKVPAKPEFPIFSACFGMAVIALTVAPTLHDTLFATFGNDWAWALGILTGVVWGAFVAYSILDGGRDSEKRTLLNWLGVVAAIGMAFALGMIRLMNATDTTDYVVAAAFTILEIFVAAGLEAAAMKFHKQQNDYLAKDAIAKEAADLAVNVEAELATRQDDVRKLSDNIQHYIDYVSERELRSVSKPELIASARNTAQDAVNDALEFNLGKIRGVNR